MDQKKIGEFLKILRKERGLTQEQLAEVLSVSNRSVSRWETGSNLPDLSLLIQLADYYDVELRELLDGERKEKPMDKRIDDTARRIADYSNLEKQRYSRRLCILFSIGLFAFTLYLALSYFGLSDTFMDGLVAGVALGFAYGTMIVSVLYVSGLLLKLREAKLRLLGRLAK